ncbi:MAG TPA: hypothetical protein DCL71_04820 [Bifidobacterium sp.]|nr:hypothetical protein [Bifidobacterium sp.]
MNQMTRRSLGCLLSVVLLCSCVGCTSSVHETSEGDAVQSSSKNDDAAEQAYKTFTVDALDRVAVDDLNDSDKLVLVNKLGAKSVHDDAIPFAKKVDENNMYYVVSMCKQKEQAPYSLVLYKDGQPHTLTTRESCTSNGVETVSLPAKNFLGATSLSIINIGNTDLIVSVYEVKENHRE